MATIQGIGGSVTLPAGFHGKIDNFTFNLDMTTVITTGFIDVGWHVHEPVIQDFTGTASGTVQFDAATTTPVPAGMMGATPDPTLAKGTITLQFTTGCTWTFTGTIKNITGARPVAGKADISYGFEHAGGGVVQVWDETAPI